MNRTQLIVIASAVGFFFLLYFGCDTKPKQQQQIEKTRALNVESTDVKVLLQNAKEQLSSAQAGRVFLMEESLAQADSDTSRAENLKELSGLWYDLGHPAIAGFYAQQVAELLATEESWSIAGTTYSICLQREDLPKVRAYCAGRAIRAFENALSLDPNDLVHQVNLALVYTTEPLPEDPMRGVLMLRQLNEQHPDNVLILNTLARLAIRTGQFDRAIERLERSRQLEPDNRTAICLLAEAYRGVGREAAAQELTALCTAAQ